MLSIIYTAICEALLTGEIMIDNNESTELLEADGGYND